MALTIYGNYKSRASRNVWMALELGVPYTHQPVAFAKKLADPLAADAPYNTRTPAYLQVNPNSHVPAVNDDGLVMFESLAINLHLARKHGGPLAPKNDDELSLMTMWALWAATECEPHTLNVMAHRVMYAPEDRVEAIALKAIETLKQPFAVLDAHLAKNGGWLVGGRFTVADLNAAEVFRYATLEPGLFDGAPNVKAWLAACHERPAFQEMMALRNAEV